MNIKDEITKLKKILKATQSIHDFNNTMEHLYERITNRKDKDYNKEYSLGQIIKSKVIKKLTKIYDETFILVVEIIRYETAPKNCVIIINIFENQIQTELEIYI